LLVNGAKAGFLDVFIVVNQPLKPEMMDQILEFFRLLFQSDSWPARWACGNWTGFHGWLYILSSFLISAAYLVIPFILYSFISRRKDTPFVKVFWLFILFILSCSLTHLFDGIIFWIPLYRVNAMLLLCTAVVSWFTVFALIKTLPQVFLLRTPAQSEQIIAERTFELNQSNLLLRKMNQDLDNYVYAASHDLKSPINNLEGLVGILLDDIADGKVPEKRIVDKIQQSVVRVQGTIKTLTEVISLEKNPYDDVELISITDVLNEIIFENEELINRFHLKINREIHHPEFEYSRNGFKSILYNLITNAAKYSSPERMPEASVRTFLDEETGRMVLEVVDNGLGIDLNRHQNRLFKMFKRLHDHVEGSGIGLYSIKQLIERKGGSLEVESQLNVGSTFRIRF
jgi:hypothetical protein